MNPDTKGPVPTTRANWYFRLFLYGSAPVAAFIYNEVMVNGKPFSWIMFLGAYVPMVTALLGFMSRSVPEETKGQSEKRREEAINHPPMPTPVVIDVERQQAQEPIPVTETPPVPAEPQEESR